MTDEEATNALYSRLKTTAEAAFISVGIFGATIRYIGRDTSIVPPLDKFFLEATKVTDESKQSAFGIGKRLYTTKGTLTVRIYAPQVIPNNYRLGERLASALVAGYRPRQTAGEPWYREARKLELPIEKGAYRFNVIVNYTYDERQ